MRNIDKNRFLSTKNQKVSLLINMAENVRHWKQTTTGRKNIPIAEFEKAVKKPKAKAKKADAE